MKTTSQILSSLIAIIVLCLLPSLASAQISQPPKSGLESLWAFGKERGRAEQDRVVGLVGFFGQEQPSQWLVLVSDARVPSTYREYISRQGRIVNMRTFQRQPNQDMPSIPLPLDRLKVDSQQAFQISEGVAAKAGIGFDSLHYQLRCRDLRNEPVWVVNLLNRNRSTIGVVYLSAVDGSVLRTVWNQPGNAGQYTQAAPRPMAPRTAAAPQPQPQQGLFKRIFGKTQSQAPAISGPAPQQPSARPQTSRQQQPPVSAGSRNIPAPPQYSNGR